MVKWTLVLGAAIGVPLVLVDSYMFGQAVLAPLNIVLYNVFPANPELTGPDIYGTEPLSFYLRNCVLNFNVVAPFVALLAAPALLRLLLVVPPRNRSSPQQLHALTAIACAIGLWVGVFFTRPHKEERFLYPIYPLLLVAASWTLSAAAFVSDDTRAAWLRRACRALAVLLLVAHALLSVSRGLALHKNYAASMDIYKALNEPAVKFASPATEHKELIQVCVGKEWHRFPSSFFVPEDLTLSTKRQRWRLAFVRSEFGGQLPGRFVETKDVVGATRHVDSLFNDQNKQVAERFVPIERCDYLIDTDNKQDTSAPSDQRRHATDDGKWRVLRKLAFLDADLAAANVYRSFYVPYLYERHVKTTWFKLRMRAY